MKSSRERELQREKGGSPASNFKVEDEKPAKGIEEKQPELGKNQENVVTWEPTEKRLEEYYFVSFLVAWQARSSLK